MKLLPKGLWPVMLTPFDERNNIDYDALGELTEFYIEAGANGLFANCLSSEMFQLTDDERLGITKKVVGVAKGRVPVVSTGTFGGDMDFSANFINRLYDTGVDAVIVTTNQLCDEAESDEVFKVQAEKLMDQTGNIPLGLYECPVPYKRLLSPDLLQWLSGSDRFLFHKDTSCDIVEIKKKIKATEGTSLGIYNAHIPTGVESILAGARGLAPISANLYPELLTTLLELIEDQVKTEQFHRLNATLDLMDTIIHYNYPYTAKLFLARRGLNIKAQCRIPHVAMKVQDHKKLETIMMTYTRLCEEYNITAKI